MVRKLTDQGTGYHEPPYTAAEEADLYRRMGGVVAFTRPDPKKVAPAKPDHLEAQQQQPEAPRRAP